MAQALDVAAAAVDVVGGQAPVEGQAGGVGQQLVGRALAEAAVPERHGRWPLIRGRRGRAAAWPAPRRPSSRRPRTAACRRRPRCRAGRASPERSRAEATTWAHPGGVRSTTRLPRVGHLGHPLAEHPAQVVVRGEPLGLVLGDGVGQVAARQPHLHRAEVLEVARHGRLRGGDARRRRAARRAAAGSSPGARPGAGRCGAGAGPCVVTPAPPPASAEQEHQQAPHGVHAVLGLAPDVRPAARPAPSPLTSSPRWAGRQCRKIASRRGAAISASSTVKPAKAARRSAASSSWPIDVHTSV